LPLNNSGVLGDPVPSDPAAIWDRAKIVLADVCLHAAGGGSAEEEWSLRRRLPTRMRKRRRFGSPFTD
jgi:hypothetical protein